jgi:arsenate reductase
MNKIYYLKTCDTCKRILKKIKSVINDLNTFELQDIKTQEITVKQLEELYSFTSSYEDLFSKRAKLYKERDLKNQDLSEEEIKHLILEHYTFLKRPVIIYNKEIFIGNSKKNIAKLLEKLQNEK